MIGLLGTQNCNIYVPNKVPKCMKQKLTELKRVGDSSAIVVLYFNTLLTKRWSEL